MQNIHLIPTDKPSRLQKTKYDNLFIGLESKLYSDCISHHIYITADEVINDVRPHKGKWHLEKEEILNKFPTYLTDLTECKLVIMTTDPELIKEGIQPIENEFLEWFVNHSNIKQIEIKKGFENETEYGYNFLDYKIIIPK